jgi:hypothetical protein
MKSILFKMTRICCFAFVFIVGFVSDLPAVDVTDVKLKLLSDFLGEEGFPEALKDAVLANVRESSGKDRIVGKLGSRYYAVAFQKTSGQNPRLGIAARNITKVYSSSDCLKYFVLNQVYLANQMNRGNFANDALKKAFSDSTVVGKIKPDYMGNGEGNGWVFGFTVASADKMTAQLTTSGAKDSFYRAYRKLVHDEADAFIAKQQWKPATEVLQHLVDVGNTSPGTWLALGKCLAEQEKNSEAGRALLMALSNPEKMSSSWLLSVGEIAADLGKSGEPAANKAFAEACKAFDRENNTFDLEKALDPVR